jgi:hypothetical protein
VTKEEFSLWQESRTTQEVFAILKEVREAYAHTVVSGGTLGSESQTARVIGNIEAFDYLLNIQFEEHTNSVL